ncbi:MAG: hypothetical protein ED554_12605 [Synechococcus sp. YX04-3]|jgi:hypothetical protein|nr:putative conserved secreted protein [Synechococcus sp. RS9915]RNC86634.1 MAG: hypothetical protein ED554_12605 [Synechococcus sp. YX04-3]
MMNINRYISTAIIASLMALNTVIPSRAEEIDLVKDLNELRLSLIEAGFKIRFEKPPMQGTYGLINIKKKVIWIAPITQQMGIFRATFLHEAIHAAQTCRTGSLQPIGWMPDVDEVVKIAIESILYRNYESEKFEIEREAFLMQGQPDAVPKIRRELKDHC